jgi:hypothetical protein
MARCRHDRFIGDRLPLQFAIEWRVQADRPEPVGTLLFHDDRTPSLIVAPETNLALHGQVQRRWVAHRLEKYGDSRFAKPDADVK